MVKFNIYSWDNKPKEVRLQGVRKEDIDHIWVYIIVGNELVKVERKQVPGTIVESIVVKSVDYIGFTKTDLCYRVDHDQLDEWFNFDFEAHSLIVPGIPFVGYPYIRQAYFDGVGGKK